MALDLERGAPFGDVFDLVLVDAPCTGLGTIRRDVDIRWRRAEADVQRAATAQRTLLREAARVRRAARAARPTPPARASPRRTKGRGTLAEAGSGFAPVGRATLVAEGVPEALLDVASALVTRLDLHGLEAFLRGGVRTIRLEGSAGRRL